MERRASCSPFSPVCSNMQSNKYPISDQGTRVKCPCQLRPVDRIVPEEGKSLSIAIIAFFFVKIKERRKIGEAGGLG